MNKYLSKGQSLYELVVAIFVVGIALVGVVRLATISISNNTFSKQRTLAADKTQEAVEWIRSQRDEDWGAFINKGGVGSGKTYCLKTLDWNSPTSCGTNDYIAETNLIRQAIIIYDAGVNVDRAEVRVTSTWKDTEGMHESRVSTYLTNWRTK